MYEKMLESSIAAMSGKDIENTVIATGDDHPIVEVSDPTSTTVEAADVVVGERNLDDATAKAEAQIKDFTKLSRLFGVDRTLVSLLNNDNKLSSMFGVSIPSCESINGSPTTFLSKACLTSDVPAKKIAASLKEVCDHAMNHLSIVHSRQPLNIRKLGYTTPVYRGLMYCLKLLLIISTNLCCQLLR